VNILAQYMAENPPEPLPAAFGVPKAFTLPFTTRSSHVRTAESCMRKGYLNEVCGHPDEETEAKNFGTDTHTVYEHWFKAATPPPDTPHGKVARRSLHLYPAPGQGLGVEMRVQEVLKDGTVYNGAIDLADLRAPAQLIRDDDGRGLRLYDHKTCGSLNWAKDADTLARDVSAVFYAMQLRKALHAMGWDEKEIPARWVYSERNPNGKTRPVDFLITREAQRERWAKTLETVGNMRKLAEQGPHWTDVTPNYKACSAYGGCKFQGQCNLARRRTNMGLLDNLRASMAVGQQVTAQPPAPAAPPGGVLAMHLAKATPAPAPQQPAAEAVAAIPVAAAVPVQPGLEEGITLPMTEPITGVVPPDAPAPDLTKDTVEKKTRKKREKVVEGVPVLTYPQQVTEALGQGSIMAAAAVDAMNVAIGGMAQPSRTAAPQPNPPPTPTHRSEVSKIDYEVAMAEGAFIDKLRKYAEDQAEKSPALALALFTFSNKLERGEL
jgi:hypothetical protein